MTASQKAMLLAMEYPEGPGRGKKSEDSSLIDFSGQLEDSSSFQKLVQQACLIVRWAGDMADRVAAGAVKLNERALFPKGDNERFGQWLATNNLSVANDAERAAAMWAAAG